MTKINDKIPMILDWKKGLLKLLRCMMIW